MRKCSFDKLDSVFAEIAKNASLYIPVDKDNGAVFEKWSEGAVYSKALNTNRSAKDFFFPQTENMMEFKTSGIYLCNCFAAVFPDFQRLAISSRLR